MDSTANSTVAISKPWDEPSVKYVLGLEEKVDRILSEYEHDRSSLISILLDIQDEFNYVPKEAIQLVASRMGVRPIEIFSVITFYKVFSLKPRGKHIISVCLGTACHVRGGEKIVDEIHRKLDIKDGETTDDRLFTLESVRCLGACALGPVVVIDGEYHGQMSAKKVDALLNKFIAKGEHI